MLVEHLLGDEHGEGPVAIRVRGGDGRVEVCREIEQGVGVFLFQSRPERDQTCLARDELSELRVSFPVNGEKG